MEQLLFVFLGLSLVFYLGWKFYEEYNRFLEEVEEEGGS